MKETARGVALCLVIATAVTALYLAGLRADPLIMSGVFEADEIRLGSRVGGRVAEVLVSEGDTVSKGDVLVRLEPYDLLERRAATEARRAAAEAVFAKLSAGYRAEEIARSTAGYSQAKYAFDEARAGPREQEKREARDAVRLAEAELELAEQNFQRVDALRASKSVSREEFDRVTSQRKVARSTLDVRRAQLDMAEEGTRVETIAQAKARMDSASADMELHRNGYRKEEIDQARAERDAAVADLAALNRQIEELTVVAPCSGVVEAVELQPGDLIAANAPVLTLLDTRRLWVRAYLPENRLGSALLGQELSMTVDGFPDRRFRGRVTFVARQAEFTPGNVQTPEERSKQVFRVKLELLDGFDLLRAGMAADIHLSDLAVAAAAKDEAAP